MIIMLGGGYCYSGDQLINLLNVYIPIPSHPVADECKYLGMLWKIHGVCLQTNIDVYDYFSKVYMDYHELSYLLHIYLGRGALIILNMLF